MDTADNPLGGTGTGNGGFTSGETYTVTKEAGVVNKSGTIAADEIWTNNNTYIIMNNVNVPAGVTLTIQAGTTVKFNGAYNLNVRGKLIADGTSLCLSHSSIIQPAHHGDTFSLTTPAWMRLRMGLAITLLVRSCVM